MDNNVFFGEIVYCDLTISYKGKSYEIEKIVYKNDGDLFYKKIVKTINKLLWNLMSG